MKRHLKFLIEDSSISGEIRRTISGWSNDLMMDEIAAGGISIVINELSTNILKHAVRGEIICLCDDNSISIIALDKGPGIVDIMAALKDGYSTHGTAGNGLGAIKRLASEFDIFSQAGKGTVVLAKFNKNPEEGFRSHGFSLPVKGESVSGDGWTDKNEDIYKIMVCDGLGHGIQAHAAARVAIDTFNESTNLGTISDTNLMHLALRSTRGAAVAVAYINHDKKVLEYCGLGNIVGTIVGQSSIKRLISYNGTAGLQLRKIQSLPYPFDQNSVLILHSDGLGTHWNLNDYPGLFLKHPLLIAGILYRDYARGNDDVTVVVGRYQ